MISKDMIVTWTGVKAETLVSGDNVDTFRDAETRDYESRPVLVLGDPVDHMCQRIETPSGCVAICSNNALVYIDDPSRGFAAVANCQRIGLFRIATLVDGLLTWEPAMATPFEITKVSQILVPGGAIIAGEVANRRILFTLPR